MPTSPLKRPSGGGRLGRLLASLRPPARAGPLPVQTGFPTSLADIVVKNHGRLRNSRRRHRGPAAAAPPPAAAAAAEPAPAPVSVSQERRELSVSHDAAARAPVTERPGPPGKRAELSIRPEVLAIGGVVALALLVVWSKQLVAAATLASVALAWIESARTVGGARRPETEPQESVSRRGRVSPIREAAAAAESPRPWRAERERDNGGGSDAASLWSADAGASDDDSSSLSNNTPKLKRSRSSLRKLLATKLRSGSKTLRGTAGSSYGGEAGEHEHEHAETPRRRNAEPAAPPAEETRAPRPPEAITDVDGRGQSHRRRGRALPLPALVPVFLAGLVAGKLPALALAVLCLAFSSSVQRVPDSGGRSPR